MACFHPSIPGISGSQSNAKLFLIPQISRFNSDPFTLKLQIAKSQGAVHAPGRANERAPFTPALACKHRRGSQSRAGRRPKKSRGARLRLRGLHCAGAGAGAPAHYAARSHLGRLPPSGMKSWVHAPALSSPLRPWSVCGASADPCPAPCAPSSPSPCIPGLAPWSPAAPGLAATGWQVCNSQALQLASPGTHLPGSLLVPAALGQV